MIMIETKQQTDGAGENDDDRVKVTDRLSEK